MLNVGGIVSSDRRTDILAVEFELSRRAGWGRGGNRNGSLDGVLTVAFAGLISPGLYQLNVIVPTAAFSGDDVIGCTYSGSATPAGDVITVKP